MRSPEPITVEELLRYEPWLRALLGSLLARDDVDDAVQQTWLAALSRPPGAIRRLRSWLGSVARNVAMDTHRRRARGRTHSRDEIHAAEEPSVALERLELQRWMVATVLELPESSRTPLVLRFYREKPYRQIAAELDCTEVAARQKVSRALAQLRQRLAGRYGPDWRASAVLIAFAQPGRAESLSGSGALAFGVVALTFVGVGVFGLLRDPDPGAPTTGDGHRRASLDNTEPQSANDPVVRRVAHRQDTTAPARGITVQGLALTPRGRPLVGATIVAASPPSGANHLDHWGNNLVLPVSGTAREGAALIVGISIEAGEFRAENVPAWSHLHVAGGYAAVVTRGIAEGHDSAAPIVLVAAPAVDVAGTVLDAAGNRVPGAIVTCVPEPLVELPVQHSKGMRAWYDEATANGNGEFELNVVPGSGYELEIRAPGFDPARLPIPERSITGLTVRLVRRPHVELRGVVRDPNGVPVAGAWVSTGRNSTLSNAHGEFSMTLNAADQEPIECSALAPGFAPVRATLERPEIGVWNPSLGKRTVQLGGRVVDGSGRPVSGLLVSVWRPTDLGGAVAEELAASLPSTDELLSWVVGSTDEDGRFSLPHMLNRTYRLVFVQRASEQVMRSDPLLPGEDHELLWDPPSTRFPVTVLDASGRVAAGVRVSYHRRIVANGLRELSVACKPDGSGRITVVEPQAWSRAKIHVHGDEWMSEFHDWSDAFRDGQLVLVATRPVRFQVELGGHRDATHARFVNDQNKPLGVRRSFGHSSVLMAEFSLQDGRCEVMTTSDAATALVLLRDGEEVGRIPVGLRGSDLHIIRG
ncbi:MAG: sigma-70 family RNA polymerase sigma factor [bacterium]|nr:sigma-70 family RNA polymerase sigma factor [bacterium]